MEEGRLVDAQPHHNDVYDCSRGHKSRFRVSHDASPLLRALAQPTIRQRETLAAVVNLLVLEAGGRTALHDGDVLASTVADARHVFSEMDRGIGIVANAQQEHLATKLVDATHGLSGPCGGDSGCGAVMRSASGPTAAKAWVLSLRRTSGSCQKELAVTPMTGHGVLRGSKGWSSSSVILGMTSVPPSPSAARSASISPSGSPSNGPAFEKAV